MQLFVRMPEGTTVATITARLATAKQLKEQLQVINKSCCGKGDLRVFHLTKTLRLKGLDSSWLPLVCGRLFEMQWERRVCSIQQARVLLAACSVEQKKAALGFDIAIINQTGNP
jgi:hypothetical protein